MAKQYKGSLSLEWLNKQKSILSIDTEGIHSDSDTPAPKINWINKDEALYYEISEEEGRGILPYWVDKNDIRVKEARPLIFQKGFIALKKEVEGSIPGTSYTYDLNEISSEQEAKDIKSILIKGDNLLALNTIKHRISSGSQDKVKFILIDPPYNTKKAFTNYDDNLAHSEWLSMTRDRLIILRDILAEDGVIAVHIDDSESAYLKILLDEVFGRENFLQTFIWETDGNSDNQARFIGLHEYIHVYAKDEALIDHPSVIDPNIPEDSKIYRDTIQNTIIKNGFKNPMSTVKLPKGFPAQFEKGIIKKDDVVFPQYNTDLIIEDYKLQNEVDAHTGWSSKAMLLEFIESGFQPIQDKKEQSTIFSLKDSGAIEAVKKRNTSFGYVISVLRNMGNTQKMGKEIKDFYGLDTDFPKPESITAYLIKIFSEPGDFVLDCFAGSGTTPACCLKTNRNFIAIELGKHAESHILTRLKSVVSGKDPIGISKEINWKGGGSFKFYHLGESIIRIDSETGKGEFNWVLGKKFIQESLLLSYDFIIQEGINLFPSQLFQDNKDKPTLGKISVNNKALYGVAFLADPKDSNLTITNEEVKTIYSTLKKQEDFKGVAIYTNKGIDIAQDTIPEDLDIIKVPHAVFAELER